MGSAARANAGVDVSKQHLDVCCGAEQLRLANDEHGWDATIAMLRGANVDLVVVEATGGYERGLVCALQGAGMAVARVNPRQARDFAKSLGIPTAGDVGAPCGRCGAASRRPSRQWASSMPSSAGAGTARQAASGRTLVTRPARQCATGSG